MKCGALIILYFLSVADCANILCFFPFPSVSHQNVFQPIWKELSLRGHQVIVITPNPLRDSKLTNLTEIDVSSTYEYIIKNPLQKVLDNRLSKIEQFNAAIDLCYLILEHQLQHADVLKLLKDQGQTFDVVLVEGFFTALHALSYKYRVPVIGVLSLQLPLPVHFSVANPTHPVLYPDLMLHYGKKLSFWERFDSTFYSVMLMYDYYKNRLPMCQDFARRHFGNDIPDLYELERNVSLIIANTNPVMSSIRPKVPNIIEVTQLHIKSIKPLPMVSK